MAGAIRCSFVCCAILSYERLQKEIVVQRNNALNHVQLLFNYKLSFTLSLCLSVSITHVVHIFFHLWSLRGIFNVSLNIFRFSKRKRPAYFHHLALDAAFQSFAIVHEIFHIFFAFYSVRWHAYAAFILLHCECDTIFYQNIFSWKTVELSKEHKHKTHIHSPTTKHSTTDDDIILLWS